MQSENLVETDATVIETPEKQNKRPQRKIADAVENWISDVKQKHARDRKLAFEKFFAGSLPASKLS